MLRLDCWGDNARVVGNSVGKLTEKINDEYVIDWDSKLVL